MPFMPVFLLCLAISLRTTVPIDLAVLTGALLWFSSRKRTLARDLQVLLYSAVFVAVASEFMQWRYWHPAHPPDALGTLALRAGQWSMHRVERSVPDGAVQAFLKAVLLGDKGGLEGQDQQDFRILGMSHMLAVSGFHVGFWVVIIGPLFRWARSIGARVLAWSMMFAFLGIYAVVVGSGASVVRAVMTFGLAHLAGIFQLRARSIHWPVVVGVMMWLWDPLVIGSLSFQLSFTAVFAILWALQNGGGANFMNAYDVGELRKVGRWQKLVMSVHISLAAWSATLPIVQFNFCGSSPFFLLGNLFLVPVYTAYIWSGFTVLVLGPVLPETWTEMWAGSFAGFRDYVHELARYLEAYMPMP